MSNRSTQDNRSNPSHNNQPIESQRTVQDSRGRSYQPPVDSQMRHSNEPYQSGRRLPNYQTPKEDRRDKSKRKSTQPDKDHPLNLRINVPWLTNEYSHMNLPKEDGVVVKPTAAEVKRSITTLMRGFRCKTPYAYHHRLAHASLSRPTEFVRQMPNPSITYLKKESWPVYNKYIGPPLNREVLRRRCHQAADPDYKVPIPDRKEIITRPTSANMREPGEIVSGESSRYGQSSRSRYPESSTSVSRKDTFRNNPEIMEFIAGIKASSRNLATHQENSSKVIPTRVPGPQRPTIPQRPSGATEKLSSVTQRSSAPPRQTTVAQKPSEVPQRPPPPWAQPTSGSSSSSTFKEPERVNRSRLPETPTRQEPARSSADKRPQAAKPPLPPTRPAASHPTKKLVPELHKTQDKAIDKGKSRSPVHVDNYTKALVIKCLFGYKSPNNDRVDFTVLSPLTFLKEIPRPRLYVQEEEPTSDLLKLATGHLKKQTHHSSHHQPEKPKKIIKRLLSPEKSQDKKPVEKKTVKKKPAEEKPVEKKEVEKKEVEKKEVEKKEVEKKEVEKKDDEKKIAERKSIDKLPNEKGLAQKPPSQKSLSQKIPAEKLPSEKILTEKRPSEQKLVEQKNPEKRSNEPPSKPHQSSTEKAIEKKQAAQRFKGTTEDTELEEGETISPSPSPPHQERFSLEESGQSPSDSRKNTLKRKADTSLDEARPEKKKQEEKPAKYSLSATGPNSDTMEQYRVFTVMFRKLAHTYKKRGDGETDPLKSAFDHFHAFCNYIISLYYTEKQSPNELPSQFSASWKSLFPLGDTLLAKLKAQKQDLLYGVCLRLISMMRFHVFNSSQGDIRSVLAKQLVKDEQKTSIKYVQMSSGVLEEYHKATKFFDASEKIFNYAVALKGFPVTFKQVCLEGNLIKGITIGGEAGTETYPMFPFSFHESLLHASIVSKCFLSETIESMSMLYIPITDTDDFMW